MIPYGRQDIDKADIDAVVDVLQSDFLTQGPAVPAFEAAIAAHCDVAHAVAVNSATSALHIAYLALGVAPGKIVWTVPNTFVATANAAHYCGADVGFVDIDPSTYLMDLNDLAKRLEAAEKSGRLPTVVSPVHFGGMSVDMRRLRELADQYGFAIVEDASHAIGAEYERRPVGCCLWSDIAVFSFHPVKIITTAEGGLATTRDAELAATMQELRTHGITRDPERMRGPSEGGWYYQQTKLGFNYRMTDMQAALGLSQMKRLDQFIARRRELANRYDQLLAGLPVGRPARLESSESSWHLYVIQVPERRRVFDALREAGIGVNVHYIPVHLQPFYRDLGFSPGDYPRAEAYYEQAISIPLYPGMSDADQDAVVAALGKALEATS
ncbi:MAG: UDP-4-amino-4,6-dideoxy-N-acetyl-beta-L-altrosamine transaminase [Gammaproteobacteria bacterium]|nr:UDP-4-amino-4,6-dideoxy-N-acetyl-beta-L-altrosamine transaminase [Gammaproteobacteria bacterium]